MACHYGPISFKHTYQVYRFCGKLCVKVPPKCKLCDVWAWSPSKREVYPSWPDRCTCSDHGPRAVLSGFFSRKDTPFRLHLFSSPKRVQRGFFTLGVPRAKRGESNTLFIVPGRFLHGTEALIHMSLICMTECRNIIRPRSVESGMDYILDIRVEIWVTTSAYQFCEIKLWVAYV